jgi:activator of HSP90 ATPase
MQELKKYYIVPEEPEIVYQALTNPITLRLWTGEPAEMSTESNSIFSLWDGSITGINLGFIDGKQIVQQWDFGDQVEPSIVTIKLHPHKKGTSVEVRQTNIPDDEFEAIAEGWDETYFRSLIEFYQP